MIEKTDIKYLLAATALLLVASCSSPESVEPESETIGSEETEQVSLVAPPPGPPPGGMPPGMPPGGPPPMPTIAETAYSAVLLVEDGVVSDDSRTELIARGSYSGELLDGITFTSAEPALNGVLVLGESSDVDMVGAEISLSGQGENDFLGIGAGAMVAAKGKLEIVGSTIETAGAISSATVATESSEFVVRGSTLIARGGPLPEDYTPRIGPGMMEPPAPLGITGTARTHITMMNAQSYFYDTTIEAYGWGALSTDAAGENGYLEANDCIINVYNSGYGAYADFGAEVVINRSTMNVATYGIIIAGAAEARLSESQSKSGGNTVMIHSVMGNPAEYGELEIIGGTHSAGGPLVLVKSANARIRIENAELSSDSGKLLEVRKK